MRCIKHHATRKRLPQTLAAAALGIAGLLLLPAANAQNPLPTRPQAQSPQAQSPSPTISDEKLNAAAASVPSNTNFNIFTTRFVFIFLSSWFHKFIVDGLQPLAQVHHRVMFSR